MGDQVQVKDIEESPGVISMMRKLNKSANFYGKIMIVSGIGLSVGMLLKGQYDLIPVSVALIAGGPSLMALGMGAKAWQAQAENRGQ